MGQHSEAKDVIDPECRLMEEQADATASAPAKKSSGRCDLAQLIVELQEEQQQRQQQLLEHEQPMLSLTRQQLLTHHIPGSSPECFVDRRETEFSFECSQDGTQYDHIPGSQCLEEIDGASAAGLDYRRALSPD